MAIRQKQPDPQELEEDRRRHEKHSELQRQGQSLQQDQLRDLLQNPQVFELLTKPDLPGDAQSSKAWLREIADEHLHVDQVLAIYGSDDLWRKGWANKIWAEQIIMSYPAAESRSADPRVREVQKRIHGHDKRPMTADEKRSIRAVMEQKTDREKRGKNGEFVDLLLSQVVKSEERSSKDDDGSSGLLPSLGGN